MSPRITTQASLEHNWLIVKARFHRLEKLLAAALLVPTGEESDRHWDEGEDLSLQEFKAIEYRRKGNAVADAKQLVRIAKVSQTRIHAPRNQSAHTGENL